MLLLLPQDPFEETAGRGIRLAHERGPVIAAPAPKLSFRGPERKAASVSPLLHRRNESFRISTVLVCGDGPDPPTGRPYMSDALRSYGHAS